MKLAPGQASAWLLLLALTVDACSRPERAAPTAHADAAPPAVVSAAAPAPSSAAPPRELPQRVELELTRVHRQQRFSWRQVREVNWQASSEGLPPLPNEPARPGAPCRHGMLLVDGEHLVAPDGRDDTDAVLLAQNRTCTRWRTRNRSAEGLCDRFDPAAWQHEKAKLGRKRLRFCIDRYEFPNQRGEFPLVVATFAESEAYCARAGKRLCTESEWTFACEGADGLPYPYGHERSSEACNIDVLAAGAPAGTYSPRTLPSTARGIDLAWQGRRSGESPRCVSPFGVEDMTGNVDEWTRSVRRYGHRMIMKSGHWGPARQRCRPQTRGHGPRYVRHDQGFRCCENAPR